MSKKLNTKKATQGFSVIKATASKQAVTKLVSFYKTNDAKQANTYAPGGVVYEVALGSVNLMDSMNIKTLTSYAKKVGGAIKLEAYDYKNNDYSALVQFGRDIQNKDHQKWVDVQSDGIGRKPQAVLKRLKEQATTTNKATSDVDTWIKSVCNGATKRGLSKSEFLQKLCDHLQVPMQIHKKTNIDNLGTFKTKTEKKLDKVANQ
tara:strand:+ start:116 stop:730 length:615 start_codon:yes stop_codon:yes gene_type:complete